VVFSVIITIGGLPGSGSTTVTRILSAGLGIDYISSGEIFRDLAKERGVTLAEFGKIAELDDSIDRMIDERQKKIASRQKDLIVEGRLSGIVIEENVDLRIWLKAPLDVRVERVTERDALDRPTLLTLIKERERSEWIRYSEYYGIDLKDLSVYDLLIDTSRWSAEEIADIILKAAQLSSV